MPTRSTPPRRQLAVRIPADLYRQLKVYAARTDTPVLAVVDAALRAYLGRKS